MSEQLKALYELQTIDLELVKLQKARTALGDGSAQKKQLEGVRAKAGTAGESLLEATSELKDKELNLKTIEAKCKTFKDKLYAGKVTNPKELSSMEKEIEMLGRQREKLDERILELMDIVDARKSALAAAQASLAQYEQAYASHMQKLKKEYNALVMKSRELIPLREKAAALVDPILLKRYEASRASKGGVVVSKVVGGDCSACHTNLLGTQLRGLKADTDIQTCESCGRILYLEQE